MATFLQHPYLIPLLVGLITEVVKILIERLRSGSWEGGMFRPGGFPSTHAAMVSSLTIVVASVNGTGSGAFAVAVTFAVLTCYDAMSSRHAIGEQAKILNRLQHWIHLPERLGHSMLEVLAGVLTGTALTFAIFRSIGA